MAYQIRISPDALRSAASKYSSLGSEIAQTVQEQDNLFVMLNNAWDGGASLRAETSLISIRDTTKQFSNEMLRCERILNSIASAFESADSENPSPFGPVIWDFGQLNVLLKCPRPGYFQEFDGPLRIVPDEVRNIAQNCMDLSSRYEDFKSIIKSTLLELEDTWEGRSFNKFSEGTGIILSELSHLVEGRHEFGAKVMDAVNRYEAVDNML